MTTSEPCPPRDHIPDVTGMCRVCGQECFQPCSAEIEVEVLTDWLFFPCRLFAGHEEDHDYGQAVREIRRIRDEREG